MSTSRVARKEFDIDIVRSLSDEEWRDLHDRSIQSNGVVGNIRLPGLPDEDLQRTYVGSAGIPALREGYRFYEVCKQRAAEYGVTLNEDSRVLDFGVGFGRMLRYWLKDVRSTNLFAVDVAPNIVALCEKLFFGACNFSTVNSHPPTSLAGASFDLIYAYSVFSHLSEETASAWINEFARILNSGGLLIATTHSRRFIRFCASLRAKPFDSLRSLWHQALARSFVDGDESLVRYDRGEFLYCPNGGGEYRDASFYGDALFSKLYIERSWTPLLELIEFVDDENYLPQACFVLRKR